MVYMLLGTGFEETEAVAPIDLLRRAGVPVATVGIGGKVIVGSHGIPVTADMELGQMDLTQLDMIVLPGGMKGVASIKGCPEALEAVQFAWENGRFVAAICAAPTILAMLGITDADAPPATPAVKARWEALTWSAPPPSPTESSSPARPQAAPFPLVWH